MKNTLLLIFLFFLNISYAQDKGSIYIGLYSGGLIETYSPIVTSPYFTKLHYYSVSFFPKLGYRYKNVTAGIIGSYAFHKNTFETLEPIWGYGYFVKYNFWKKSIFPKKKIAIQCFVEWRHVLTSGYYVSLPDFWHRAKVYSETTYLTGQGGFDILLPKSFTIGLALGIGSSNFLKDYNKLDGEKVNETRPYGNLTLQYNIKLSKNKINK